MSLSPASQNKFRTGNSYLLVLVVFMLVNLIVNVISFIKVLLLLVTNSAARAVTLSTAVGAIISLAISSFLLYTIFKAYQGYKAFENTGEKEHLANALVKENTYLTILVVLYVIGFIMVVLGGIGILVAAIAVANT